MIDFSALVAAQTTLSLDAMTALFCPLSVSDGHDRHTNNNTVNLKRYL